MPGRGDPRTTNIREAWLTLSVCLSLINAFFRWFLFKRQCFADFLYLSLHITSFFSLSFFHLLFLFFSLVLVFFASASLPFCFGFQCFTLMRSKKNFASVSLRFARSEMNGTPYTPYQMAASTSGQVTPDPSFSHCTLPLTFIPGRGWGSQNFNKYLETYIRGKYCTGQRRMRSNSLVILYVFWINKASTRQLFKIRTVKLRLKKSHWNHPLGVNM